MSKENEIENNSPEESGIGALLKAEREKKGISKRRLAEDIKVREHIIDALENEEWDKLPARVFIKGFIRSYTISIGYDTKEALKLFDKSSPPGGEDAPKPLSRNPRRSRGIYYFIIFLIILAVVIYLLKVRDNTGNNQAPAGAVTAPPVSSVSETGPPEESPSGRVASNETANAVDTREATAQEIMPSENETIIPENSAQTPEEKSEEAAEEATPAEEIPQQETAADETVPAPEAVPDEPAGAGEMLLSANVNMRTYVKIIVDDNPPKEYIFQPGSTPQWTATRGFEVTVGNAAGIEFNFNGKTYKNIGREGRVKTLRFPDDFKTEREE